MLNTNKIIKPWTLNFKAFFMLCVFFSINISVGAQNVLEKKILADEIETISIHGNQIFSISISTSKTDYITIKSTLDGEYQNQFQIITEGENDKLKLSLERMSFAVIADDKRNAHKVIAATLHLVIPEDLSLNIFSDICSVSLNGNYNLLSIELLQGYCEVIGTVNNATINTIDGDINVVTQSAIIDANSNNGNIVLCQFSISNSVWKLRTINGDITVVKPE
jgi:hypothetical protein